MCEKEREREKPLEAQRVGVNSGGVLRGRSVARARGTDTLPSFFLSFLQRILFLILVSPRVFLCFLLEHDRSFVFSVGTMLSSALEHFLGHKVTTTSVVVGALVGAIAFSFGLYCGGGAEGNVKPSKTKTKLAATTPTGVNERYKMVLCVRMDLKVC